MEKKIRVFFLGFFFGVFFGSLFDFSGGFWFLFGFSGEDLKKIKLGF